MSKSKLLTEDLTEARATATELGFDQASHLIVMCVDRRKAKCASERQLQESWRHLKHRLKTLDKDAGIQAIRIKSQCLDICCGGPVLGIFPSGTWYGGCTPEVIDRILDFHYRNGPSVDAWVIASRSVFENLKVDS